jgi:hypothetical protein
MSLSGFFSCCFARLYIFFTSQFSPAMDSSSGNLP